MFLVIIVLYSKRLNSGKVVLCKLTLHLNNYVYVLVGLVEECGPKLDSMCRLKYGCRKSKKKSSNGELYEYCCKEHAEIAKSNGEA